MKESSYKSEILFSWACSWRVCLRRAFFWSALIYLVFCQCSFGALKDLDDDSLHQILRIARAISIVQPHLKESDYIRYGFEIFRASKRYRIEPAVLIAIAQQETTFRNNLPEGKAGELGICQIRKMWLKQRSFRSEFKKAKLKDLHDTAKNFLFAAWILRGLRKQVRGQRGLPYWSYYNAVRLKHRYRYFKAVNRYIAQLRRNENFFSERAVAGIPSSSRLLQPRFIKPVKEKTKRRGRIALKAFVYNRRSSDESFE